MIRKEWLDRYLEKSGDSGLRDTTYAHHNEHGFATWEVEDGFIFVVQMFGDGKYWLGFFQEMGRKIGMNIRFTTRRSPRAWGRSYGAKTIGYIMEIDKNG